MKCPNCGYDNDEFVRSCANCGIEIGSGEWESAAEVGGGFTLEEKDGIEDTQVPEIEDDVGGIGEPETEGAIEDTQILEAEEDLDVTKEINIEEDIEATKVLGEEIDGIEIPRSADVIKETEHTRIISGDLLGLEKELDIDKYEEERKLDAEKNAVKARRKQILREEAIRRRQKERRLRIILSGMVIVLVITLLGAAAFFLMEKFVDNRSLEASSSESLGTVNLTPSVTAAPSATSAAEATPTPTAEAEPAPSEESGYLDGLDDYSAGEIILESIIDYDNLGNYFTSSEISDEIFERIYGDDKSFKTYCTVSRDDLRYLKMLHFGFDGSIYVGEMIVNAALADEVCEIFRILFENEYQINKIRLIDEYNASDEASIADNNTSAFNYRLVTGGSTLSNHATGCAIDINPYNNPYILYDANGQIIYSDPEEVENYLDRDAEDAYERHMINYDDLCYQLFTERGWTWGGDWSNPVDYQHFEKVVS